MDFTPYISCLQGATLNEVLLSVAVHGKVAIAMKGRFLLRAVCESFQDRSRIGCAVTDEEAKALFPQGWTTVKPYLRVLPQPGASA